MGNSISFNNCTNHILIFIHSATELMPAFPGIQKSFSHKGDLDIAQHNACSLPPDPKIKTFN